MALSPWLYIDTSALARASGVDAPNSVTTQNTIDHFIDAGYILASSELMELEVRRLMIRLTNQRRSTAQLATSLAKVRRFRPFNWTIRAIAESFPQTIKTLDAIHVATCVDLHLSGVEITLLTSDTTMREVAEANGVTVEFVPL